MVRSFTDASSLIQADYHCHFDVKSEDTWHATKYDSSNGPLMRLTNSVYALAKNTLVWTANYVYICLFQEAFHPQIQE